MLEQIKNGEVTEYRFTTQNEVDGLVYFITKNDLHNNLVATRLVDDYLECDVVLGDAVITFKSLRGYRYNHFLTFFRAKL